MTRSRQLVHQVRLEQLAFWRNPQTAFFTFALPLVLVLTLGYIARNYPVPQRSDVKAITLLVPGFLSFGILVAAYGNLAGTIAVLRCEGVLKRVRGTPLSPSIYLGGHLITILSTCIAIAVSTGLLGWIAFAVSPFALSGYVNSGITVLLGSCCFAALGLALTPVIRSADAAGPVSNGTYVPLAIVSGNFSADLTLPSWLDTVVSVLPVKALTDGVRAGYDPIAPIPTREWVVLALWLLVGMALARRFFRWQ